MINNRPIGGDFMTLVNAEFSFPLFLHYLRGVAFVDSGIVTRRIKSATWDDYRVSAGFGFRITIPVFPAPVALDFGWPLRKEQTDKRQVFSFSVGFGF
jgi:outer membrane protein insertion porin family